MHAECRRRAPLVLIGVETAGRHAAGVVRRCGRAARFPGLVLREISEAWDGRPQPRPVLRGGPDEPGAARREHPFVGACAEVVAAHGGDGFIGGADSVHAVDDQ